MLILGIDTSGKAASCAVCRDGKILCEKIFYTKLTHSQIILPMAREVMEGCEIKVSDLDCIAVANGPGSYTGLRIGIAAVKGICMGTQGLKCAGVSTLQALAIGCGGYQGKIIPLMRARPQIVYSGVYESKNGVIKNIVPDKVSGTEEFFSGLDLTDGAMLTGDCCEEINETLFADNDKIILAPTAQRLQRASSLCAAVEQDKSIICTAQELAASYLQATKAEKLIRG